MLSLSTEYAAQSSAKNIVSDWLLELSYEDSVDGDGTFYFSGKTRTVTNVYRGNVLDWGAIDESIDIRNSQSSTSDIQIVLANSYANDSGLLSAELFGGNQKFINQDVLIKSWIPDLSLTNSLTLFKGRLTDIKHNLDTVTLTIEKRSPWDRLKMANAVTTDNRVVFPAAYGDFTRNDSTVASKDFTPSKDLFPTPVDAITGAGLMALLPDIASPSFDSPEFYERSLDVFVPLDPTNFNEDADYQGGTAIAAPVTLKRGFDYRPLRAIDATSTFTYPEKAIDGNTATYAIKSITTSDSFGGAFVSDTFYLDIDVPSIDGNLTDIEIAIKYSLILDVSSDADSYIFFYDMSYGATAPDAEVVNQNIVEGTSVTGAETIHAVAGYTTVTWFNGDRYSALNTLPDKIRIGCVFGFSGAGTDLTGQVRVHDVFIRQAAELDFSTEESAGYDKIHKVNELYNGTDGFDQDFAGGSGLAEYPHDIYRDMLDRYASWDAGNLNWVFSNGALWAASSIDTDRNWACRWWTTEQLKLREVLNQLQFEGGFMWLFDNTASTRKARIIYVKSSYSSADIVSPFGATLDYGDIANIDISITPLSEIVTKRTLNFQRHPADERRYIQSNSKTNTNRADYNLDTDENAIEQNLDFLTATGDVDDLLDYYDNIVGEPKLIVKCDLLNPVNWALQVGDIVNFANMAYDPYGKDWTTPIYFMCTRTNVSPNKFTATFREVG